ncbi:LicD family protein [Acidaminococcus timonensis]|uniref:LicD family protein n=1 Tax=Acidaminococcus timonensis TaxID=1871002 RepID=UPI0026E9B5E3|nr:LicD family protein [Acidaminococcus timonensis]
MDCKKIRELSSEELDQIHHCLLSILKDFIFVCDKYNLHYTLGGGSVLGSVRHQGFIPWDDDLDINMPRADYEKFKKIFSKELVNEYELRVPNSKYGSSALFMKL